jgi:glycosyltransferase involved in cell wall biosynthesis
VEIDQISAGVSEGDAITSMMLEIRSRLRTVVPSEIYAHHIDPRLADIRRLGDLPAGGRGDRLLIYHCSIGEPAVTRTLLARPEPLVLVYHNITPSELFLDAAFEIAPLLEWGRKELALLADRCALAVAISDYNARDLRSYGYDEVHVVPVGVEPNRLTGLAPNLAYREEITRRVGERYVLSVSQLFPHKRHELVIQAQALVRAVHLLDAGLVIVGATRAAAYRRALDALVEDLALESVHFAGAIDDRSLATLYAGAQAFVTASEHEGLALPPLEAMAFGVPVVARACGALPDTIGNGGLLLPAASGPRELAEALAMLLGDRSLSRGLAERGRCRVAQWRSSREMARFLDLVAGLL